VQPRSGAARGGGDERRAAALHRLTHRARRSRLWPGRRHARAADGERLAAHAIVTSESDGFAVSPTRLGKEVERHNLDAFLLSNPCNPTGAVVRGKELAAYVELARTRRLTLMLDEFYSHFVYDGERPGAGPLSAAAHVEDVDHDPVVLVDGLTKSFRYPGWRLGWAVGPRAMIDSLGRAASALDGGPSMPVQRAAVQVLEAGRADQETHALREVFAKKRNLMLARLAEMGSAARVRARGRSTSGPASPACLRRCPTRRSSSAAAWSAR
jgi:aspartate/methionine/tyrosine aminotransferase